jgi:ApbE superfamily uncharacterized protein (UPF0280 family)
MQEATAALLDDGRLHLHHGPIDLIIEAEEDQGGAREASFRKACRRFEHLLQEIVEELPELRRPTSHESRFKGSIAHRMQAATVPFADHFITPMAAVAGSVADEILEQISSVPGITRAYVNNGGDIALLLNKGQEFDIAAECGRIRIAHDDRPRGVATSGWRGRSHSLGIADSVTVLADNAAMADAAATIIANAVDLPGHPAIRREPACELSPDSDLGERPVTTHVGPLSEEEAAQALRHGADCARHLIARNLIASAMLSLCGIVMTAASTHRGVRGGRPHPERLTS